MQWFVQRTVSPNVHYMGSSLIASLMHVLLSHEHSDIQFIPIDTYRILVWHDCAVVNLQFTMCPSFNVQCTHGKVFRGVRAFFVNANYSMDPERIHTDCRPCTCERLQNNINYLDLGVKTIVPKLHWQSSILSMISHSPSLQATAFESTSADDGALYKWYKKNIIGLVIPLT